MPRNGSGSYGLPAGNPVVPSTVISSTWANTTLSDIGTALTQSIANDGQTTPVANLPMATFRHTNVGNAVARNDYAAAGQVQDSSLQWLTSVAGTDTITATITPSPTAYTAGQTFRFVAAGANTGAATLNINGLGAKNITRSGTAALVASDIVSGAVVEVVYDGTQFQLSSNFRGQLIAIQRFSSDGTYTASPGTRLVIIEAVGGGGGGGGAPATAAGQVAPAQGGGAGTYGKAIGASGFSGATITIGAGGNGGAAGSNAGQAGGTTSFGTLLVCPGGTGGNTVIASTPPVLINGSGISTDATVGGGASLLVTQAGYAGGYGFSMSTAINVGGAGAQSPFGSGNVRGNGAGAGGNGVGSGSGGSGAASVNGTGALAGGNGTSGLVIVYEYA